MKKLLNKIQGLFKMATLLSSEEGQTYLSGVISYMGSEGPAQIFQPYGTMARPPDGALCAVFAQGAMQSNAIAFASDPGNRPLTDLEPGEYAIGNYGSGSYLLFKENGDVNLMVKGNYNVIVDEDITRTVEGAISDTADTTDTTASSHEITGDALFNDELQNQSIVFLDHVHAQNPDSAGDTQQPTEPPQ